MVIKFKKLSLFTSGYLKTLLVLGLEFAQGLQKPTGQTRFLLTKRPLVIFHGRKIVMIVVKWPYRCMTDRIDSKLLSLHLNHLESALKYSIRAFVTPAQALNLFKLKVPVGSLDFEYNDTSDNNIITFWGI